MTDRKITVEVAMLRREIEELRKERDAAIERAEKAEVACAEMRTAAQYALGCLMHESVFRQNTWTKAIKDLQHALSSDAGKGWHSPEELAKLMKERDLAQQALLGGLLMVQERDASLAKLRAENERLREALAAIAHSPARCLQWLRSRQLDTGVDGFERTVARASVAVDVDPCYCTETSSRNCPRHQNAEEK